MSQLVFGSRTADVDEQKNYIDYQATIVPFAASMRNRKNSRISKRKQLKIYLLICLANTMWLFQIKPVKLPQIRILCAIPRVRFDFIQRLLQSEGIFYFFEHTKSNYTLVLADDITAYEMCGEAKVVHSTGHLSESHVSYRAD